jgi:SAM-dependent methyltransferase
VTSPPPHTTSIPELAPEILAFYAQGREDGRLREGTGRLELWRTQDILRRVLPAPDAGHTLLDIGGGPGIHAAWLAADGWAVELIDPVPSHVERAATLPGVTARLGDARALDLDDSIADVVLLLGPLYHLPDPDDRRRALSEAARAVRPGGTVVVATINRHAALHDQLNQGGWFEPGRRARLEATSASGRIHPGGDFTTAYFHHPTDIAAEMTAVGLLVTGQYGIEGAAWLLGDITAYLDDEERREGVLAALRITESDPALLGISGHLLTAARRS